MLILRLLGPKKALKFFFKNIKSKIFIFEYFPNITLHKRKKGVLVQCAQNGDFR